MAFAERTNRTVVDFAQVFMISKDKSLREEIDNAAVYILNCD